MFSFILIISLRSISIELLQNWFCESYCVSNLLNVYLILFKRPKSLDLHPVGILLYILFMFNVTLQFAITNSYIHTPVRTCWSKTNHRLKLLVPLSIILTHNLSYSLSVLPMSSPVQSTFRFNLNGNILL